MILTGRKIFGGQAQGEALVSATGISFFGGVDPETGVIVERGHELLNQCVAGRVLVFPSGKGSTVGSYTLYRLSKAGLAPAAIVNAQCETITAVGCIIGEIPCIDQVAIQLVKTGQAVRLDADQGILEIIAEPAPALPTGENLSTPGDILPGSTHRAG